MGASGLVAAPPPDGWGDAVGGDRAMTAKQRLAANKERKIREEQERLRSACAGTLSANEQARNAQQRQAAATIVTKSGGGGGLYTIGDDDGSEGAAQLAGQPRGSRASRGL